ncbi:MAG: cytochrome P460 family protein [Verrucomicrobia bacterium]|nr:cytochrome P460 family protein [Verrucomicrobiota bacterium]
MKKELSLLMMSLISLMAGCTADSAPPIDGFIFFAQQRTNAVRITEKPVRMHDRVSSSCAPFRPESLQEQRVKTPNSHWQKYVHVYVSPQGASAMKSHSAAFPRGTLILKEKFGDAEGTKTELFTGMIKRESGYNPDCGDWEFFTLSADAKQVTSRGKLKNCMACHVEYKDSDYVTKEYVPYSQRKKPQ